MSLAPERLPRLVMVASAAVVTARAHHLHRCFEVAALRLTSVELAQLFTPFVFGRTFHERRPELVAEIMRAMRPNGPLIAAQALLDELVRRRRVSGGWVGRHAPRIVWGREHVHHSRAFFGVSTKARAIVSDGRRPTFATTMQADGETPPVPSPRLA